MLNESVSVSAESVNDAIDDVSTDEAITQDLNFDLDDEILPCVPFSEGFKQCDKVTKHCMCNLLQKDLPRHLVIL